MYIIALHQAAHAKIVDFTEQSFRHLNAMYICSRSQWNAWLTLLLPWHSNKEVKALVSQIHEKIHLYRICVTLSPQSRYLLFGKKINISFLISTSQHKQSINYNSHYQLNSLTTPTELCQWQICMLAFLSNSPMLKKLPSLIGCQHYKNSKIIHKVVSF